MTRISLVFVFGLLLAACSTGNASQIALTQERSACSDVGLASGNPAFAQCVATLDQSLSNGQTLDR